MSGQERISGETLRLDLDTGKGLFTKASGYLQPDVLFEADSIERVDADTYRLKGASFTACTQPNPRWMFKAQSATVDIDKKIKATMVGLRIKGVPTPLIIPYFQFPISPDQRSTGILMPRYGSSSGVNSKGREIGLGFFWAMGRSVDQTFYYDWYTKYGTGIGHEFRFIRNSASRGTFRSYFTKQNGCSPDTRTTSTGPASQALPRRFKATLSANFYSDLQSRQTLQDSIDYSSHADPFGLGRPPGFDRPGLSAARSGHERRLLLRRFRAAAKAPAPASVFPVTEEDRPHGNRLRVRTHRGTTGPGQRGGGRALDTPGVLTRGPGA